MSQLPTGTVTFLFTDIEGSTRLLQEHGDDYRTLLEKHAELIRQAIAETDGVEVGTGGDSFFVAFDSAPDALRAAVLSQVALAAHAWPPGGEVRVRMGLHTGLGRLGGDSYVGLDVHRAARLMAAAHGGQIVVSESTHSLVRDDPRADVSLLDLGVHRLKDLAQPERVYQVVHPDLPTEFPPLGSLEGFPNNLPAQLSSFLGREETLRAVQEVVDASRLVTLTGPGGVGKTRLALQVAADRIERHLDGVWLAEFGGLADPDLVPQAVRSALGVPESPGRPAVASLIGYLERKDVLLALDNCEHLIDAAAGLVAKVLGECPQVRVLATSREPLHVPGEATWPVPPMTVPTSDDAVEIENPPEAVVLFVERARAADPGFDLTQRNAPAIAAICRRLDGLPLAIELAAARVRALPVQDIATRLREHLAVLSVGSRTALPRQQTLEATVAWSYDLLNEAERVVFTRLGMFSGPFDLSAAEEVGAGGDIERHRVLDLLSGLVDKSLLAVVRDEEEVRYRMLATIRDYARARLAETPDLPDVQEAHTRWALGFAEQANKQMVGPQMRVWLFRARSAFDDLRAVLERSLEQGDPETGLRMLIALEPFLIQAAVQEGAHWLDQLLSAGDVGPEILAPSLSLRGALMMFQGDVEAAVPVLERSLELFDTLEDPGSRAGAQLFLANAWWGRSEPGRARQLLISALETFEAVREFGPRYFISLFALALWELQFGDPSDAERIASQLERVGEQSGAAMVKAHATELYGLRAHFAGDQGKAQTRFVETIGHYREAGFPLQCFAHCLGHIALWTLDQGRPERAASLLGLVEMLREKHVGTTTPPFERIWHDQAATEARQQLGAATFERHFQEGRQAGPKDAAEIALATLLGARTGTTTSS
jgi:predicted ATPase/class 3 adenylate cyclase